MKYSSLEVSLPKKNLMINKFWLNVYDEIFTNYYSKDAKVVYIMGIPSPKPLKILIIPR